MEINCSHVFISCSEKSLYHDFFKPLCFNKVASFCKKFCFNYDLKVTCMQSLKEIFKIFFFLGRYTSVYNPYKYLIAVETENKVKKFISKERPLREYRNEIEKLKKLISAVGSLPVTIPMHLFYLDCNHINQVNTPYIFV